jgi:hypothetical protein
VIDRLVHGAVMDFVPPYHRRHLTFQWYVFNLRMRRLLLADRVGTNPYSCKTP